MPLLVSLEEQPGHQKTENPDGSISYNIVYFATFDSPVTDGFTADLLAGFSKGQVLSFATALTLQSWVTKETDSPEIWSFNCSYQSATYNGSDPTNKIEIETFSWTESREVIATNTAGEPMFPAVQETEYYPGIRVIWNDANLDMSDYNIGGAVNSQAITVAGISLNPYEMKAGALEFNKVTDGTNTTWQKVLPLYFCFKKAKADGNGHSIGDSIGFRKEIVSNGFSLADGSLIPNADGSERTQPARLNLVGDAALVKGDPDVSVLVVPSELDDFSSFNLPTSAPS